MANQQRVGKESARYLRVVAIALALSGSVGIFVFGVKIDDPFHIGAGILGILASGIAWRWELLGGIALITMSLPLLLFAAVAQLWPEASVPLWHLPLTMLPSGGGVLFVVDWLHMSSSVSRGNWRGTVLVLGGVILAVGIACCLPPLAILGEYSLRPLVLRGDGLRRITPFGEAWGHVTGIAWSPDSEQMACTWSVGGGPTIPQGYIYILELDRGEPRVLAHTEVEAYLSQPTWSVSDEIAFLLTEGTDEPWGIWLADINDSQELEYLGEGIESAWAPQGDRLALVDWVRRGQYGIFILDTRTGEAEEVYRVSGSGNAVQFNGISWSPLGDQLAFSLGIAEDGSSVASDVDIYVLDLSTGESRRVTDGGINEYPSWSPDGMAIAFSGGSSRRDRTLCILDLDDNSVVQPVDAVDIGPVAWSPDGRWIAFGYWGYVYVLDVEVVQDLGR